MKIVRKVPDEINYDDFKWIRNGDFKKIAKDTGLSESMVYKTLDPKVKAFNIKILEAALKMVIERKKNLLALQAESNQLSQLLEMKIAS